MLKRVLFILLALSILTACVCAVSCTDGDTENSSTFSSRTSSDTSSRGNDTSSRDGSDDSGNRSDNSGDRSGGLGDESSFDNASIGDHSSGIVDDILSGAAGQ